jgi:hypothetical protein
MKLIELGRQALRRLAGPDPVLLQKLLHAQADARREREQRLEMSQRAHDRTVDIQRLQARLAKAMNVEPPAVEGCVKVRLRDQDEAWEFARRVAEDSGQRLDLFEVYACDICPRQPVGTSRFLHITSRETDDERREARQRRAGQRKRNGTALGDRIDPAVLERLKAN